MGNRFLAGLCLDPLGADRWRAAAGPAQLGASAIAARAMIAAGHTVDTRWRLVHSVHLARSAEVDPLADPLEYRVERLHEDEHRSVRQVRAVLEQAVVAVVTVCFQVARKGLGPSWQPGWSEEPPNPHAPHARPSEGPIELRPLDPGGERAWLRFTEELPDRILTHAAALVTAADAALVDPAPEPGTDLATGHPLRALAVELSMHVHRSFRADDWLLHERESSSASEYRTSITGRVYSSMGRLVASVGRVAVLVPAVAEGSAEECSTMWQWPRRTSGSRIGSTPRRWASR